MVCDDPLAVRLGPEDRRSATEGRLGLADLGTLLECTTDLMRSCSGNEAVRAWCSSAVRVPVRGLVAVADVNGPDVETLCETLALVGLCGLVGGALRDLNSRK